MQRPHYVERVFVLFKRNPTLKGLVKDSKSSLFVMRVDASKKGIILESWEKFKAYCETLKKEFPHLSQREVTTIM